MTDRELLELAARAAGHEVWTDIDGNLYTAMNDLIEKPWNPLADDGDALRLAVKLGIDEIFTVAIVGRRGCVAACDANLELSGAEEKLLEDPYAATRRAIVRAAAEIGKEMK